MSRLICGALALFFFISSWKLSAGVLPLSFQIAGSSRAAPLVVNDYTIHEGHELQITIHLEPETAKALQQLTAGNIGRKLLVKQGERELASPTIRAAIQGQDFALSFKNSKDLQDFRSSMR